jgi:hypothetical protein
MEWWSDGFIRAQSGERLKGSRGAIEWWGGRGNLPIPTGTFRHLPIPTGEGGSGEDGELRNME